MRSASRAAASEPRARLLLVVPSPFRRIPRAVVPEAARHEQDIVDLAPAQRRTIEFEADADPGIYLLHCHEVDPERNGNSYPGGMVGAVVYEAAVDSGIFADLMEAAGFENREGDRRTTTGIATSSSYPPSYLYLGRVRLGNSYHDVSRSSAAPYELVRPGIALITIGPGPDDSCGCPINYSGGRRSNCWVPRPPASGASER